MKEYLRIALAQINPTVGDFRNNYLKILEYMEASENLSVDLVIFPELAITGYPPEDLLLKAGFIQENRKYLAKLARESRGITAIVGFVDSDSDIFNGAAVLNNGEIAAVYRKMYLPNYSVFDENRYFMPGSKPLVIDLGGCRIGVTICEDLWFPDGPARTQVLSGRAEVIVNISASPYHQGKWKERERLISVRAFDYQAIIAYVNLIGGQDELVFDGGSMIVDQNGELIAGASVFREDFLIYDLDIEGVFRERLRDPRLRSDMIKYSTIPNHKEKGSELVIMADHKTKDSGKPPIPVRTTGMIPYREDSEGKETFAVSEIYEALVLGTRDYVRKNNFGKVVIGLSGGIDSALTAAIAVDALGKDSVVTVFMPSKYTTVESGRDAAALAEALDVEMIEIRIDGCVSEYEKVLAGSFKGKEEDVTEENIQARIRGNILMALSNKFGWLVLSTGNKSEMSVGYATLYGDMAGGFAVLKDVYKTMVYRLSRYRNAIEPVIPSNILRKPPSAELRPDQVDEDSLPPYELLDKLLKEIIEKDTCLEHLVKMGFDEKISKDVFGMVNRNEYKRRQAPPGIRITRRAFGKDRRVPLTNGYSE